MLTHLSISNYALIDSLEIDFKKGLTIITGETGAGKSILLGALSMILGERAEQRVIRDTTKKSVIEATFNIKSYQGIDCLFAENDIESFGDECILRREISSNGRSRTFINDSPVNLSLLRDLTLRLIDIHSQHSNMLLSKEVYQLEIIDNIVSDKSLLPNYSHAYTEYKNVKNRLGQLKSAFSKQREDEDYIQFQLKQIEALQLTMGEDEELESRQRRLTNLSEIKQSLWTCDSILRDGEMSVLDQLVNVAKAIRQAGALDNGVKELGERIDSVIIDLKDIASTADILQNSMVDEPGELERINERLDSIYELENKHKVKGVDELIALGNTYEEKLSKLSTLDEEILRLETRLTAAESHALECAKELSHGRKKASEEFVRSLKQTAVPLGMKNLQFEIRYNETELTASGIDRIEFLFAFNKQQELMPVENTASGGELSRLMLCIKSIIAERMQLPTIIFDEVDTGVSGDIANRMGEMMASIGKKIQVIAITHLPQVAVKGNNHYKVYKKDNAQFTYTGIRELDEEERVKEIAGMLSGEVVDEAAVNNAKSLLGLKRS